MAAIARPVFLLPWHAGSAYHTAASIDQLTTQLEEIKLSVMDFGFVEETKSS